MDPNQRNVSFIILLLAVFLIALALLSSSLPTILTGWSAILTSPSVLITDYVAVGGLAAASFNAGLMVLLYWLVLYVLRADFNGMILAGIFTVAGFSFFGKNPFNVLPVAAGILFYAKVVGKPGRSFAAPMLFASTIAPLVSQVAFGFGFGWTGIAGGILLGLAAGFLIAALARHVYSLHAGYNLYNIGATGGFIGLCAYMFMRGFGLEIKPAFFWSTGHTNELGVFFTLLLITLALAGWRLGGSLAGMKTISFRSGRLPTDNVILDGLGTTLINMAAVGLVGLLYIIIIGGVINGPVLAGLLTMTGFGALGKNLRNILPIMLGVYFITIFKIWAHTDPGPLIAALFSTALAPIAGRFGFWAGILAGILHLPMVMHVGSLHGYMNLYNNGFAGGLAVMLLIGVLKGIKPELLEEPERS
jgi:hypothetical protein